MFLRLQQGVTLKAQERRNAMPGKMRDFIENLSNYPLNEIFIKRLKASLYDENVGSTRFILCKIEELNSTKETFVDLWAKDSSNKYVWTIEHIFPQGANIPDEWVNMIANGNLKNAENIQEELVHKIGNLTLTGYNSKLSNLSFLKKRDRKDQNQKPVGYKNGLFLNNELKDKDQWREEDIRERGEFLIDLIIKYINS